MSRRKKEVAIVPCSGIGKSFGAVARLAGYDLVEDLRPEHTRLVALSKLVLGDEEARTAVRERPTITIDGCKLSCAAKLVRESGGRVAREIAVQEVFRRHKTLKPEGVAELNPAGRDLARTLAEELTPLIDELTSADPEENGHA
jgi:uncharacterized metal-binding protein